MCRSIIIVLLCFFIQTICAQNVVEKDFVVQNGEISLPGTLTLASDFDTPVIVLVHGSGPNDRNETIGQNKMFEQLAKGLAAEGVSTLRYDKRTLLYKTGVEEMTYREETVDDAVQAIRQLKAEGYKHILIAGHSLGGHLAPMIAAEAKDDLDGAILLSGNTSTLKSALDAQLHYIGKMQGATEEQIMASLNQMLASLPEKYREYDEQYDCVKTLRSVLKDKPTLRWMVVQGGHDYQVTVSDFYVWRMAFGTKATYYYGETLDHILRPLPQMATPADYMQPGNIDTDVIKAIAKFCKESANPDASLLSVEQTVNDTLWQLGSEYEFTKKDSVRAYQYYKKSADLGNAIGYYMLGHALQHGIGVRENRELSDKTYRKSVELLNKLLANGDEKILLNFLGSAYYWGDGVSQDREKAAQLYLRSAELGNPETQYKIATCYEQGIGVKKDNNKARYWYRKAAAQGWQEAIDHLKKN